MFGTTLSGYEIVEQINRGSLSEVYLARSALTGKSAAVRILVPELRGDARAVRQFLRGARLEVRCDHAVRGDRAHSGR